MACFTTVNIRAQWRYAPVTQQPGDIKMVSNTLGYAIKVNTIIKTTNGGLTWESLNINPELASTQVVDFSISSTGIGYAINNGDEFYKTVDHGNTWCRLPFDYNNNSLSRIQFMNDSVGFVISSGGYFWRTIDGGYSWKKNQLDGLGNDMHFENTLKGWVIGGNKLNKTLDGGKTWTTSTLPGEKIQIIGNSGWVFTNTSMHKTTNGGLTWDSTYLGPSASQTKKIQFINSNTGWRLTNMGFELTINGGSTWSIASGSPLQVPFEYFSFASASNGVATDVQGNYYRTTNGGTTWTVTSYGAGLQNYVNTYDVFMANSTTAFMVNHVGGCTRTTNKGKTWQPLATGFAGSLVAVYFDNIAKSGAVVGQQVMKTTIDSGVTWVDRTAGLNATYLDIVYANNTYYTIGSNGIIRKGNHTQTIWPTVTSGTSQTLRSISFPSSQIGYIVGHGGVILKTTDGGATWQSLTSGTTQNLIKVHFISNTEGIAVGFSGTVLYTSNGGTTWTSLQSNITEHFLNIAPNGNNTWWITDNRGGIYLLKAGTIRLVQELTSNPLNGIGFFDNSNGIIVANTGYILEYSIPCSGNNNAPVSYNNAKNTQICIGDSTVLFVGGKGKLKWYASAGAINPLAEGGRYRTPALTNNTTYYVEDSICNNTQRLPITVNVQTTIPTISTNTSNVGVCGERSIQFVANSNLGIINWFDPANLLEPISQGSIFNTPTLSVGSKIYLAQAQFSACNSNMISVQGVVYSQPVFLAINSDSVCGKGALKLSIIKKDNFGSAYWYEDSTLSTNPLATAVDTFITPQLMQSKTYYIALWGPECAAEQYPATALAKVKAMPNITVTQSNDTLKAIEDSVTYHWLNCNTGNSAIALANASSFVPTSSGNYSVEVMKDGCVDTSICYNIILTNVEEATANSKLLQVYPNPSSAELLIDLENDYTDFPLLAVITDSQGSRILEQEIKEQSSKLNLVALPSGTYFLNIVGKHFAVTKKLTIIK